MEEIVNRVAKSALISIDLEDYIDKGDIVLFDLKPHLFQELILRERDFRIFIKENDWSQYEGKNVGLFCSGDAIIPTWAYMLLVSALRPFANTTTFGREVGVEKMMINQAVDKMLSAIDFEGKKVVIKGCGNVESVAYAYTLVAQKLVPLVSSLMYGEPCSTVPIYKKRAS